MHRMPSPLFQKQPPSSCFFLFFKGCLNHLVWINNMTNKHTGHWFFAQELEHTFPHISFFWVYLSPEFLRIFFQTGISHYRWVKMSYLWCSKGWKMHLPINFFFIPNTFSYYRSQAGDCV